MIIGLVLLGIVAVLIFFGVATRFFQKIGLPSWVAFILVVAFVVGAVVPSIRIGDNFSMNVSGFMLPILMTVILFALIGGRRSVATKNTYEGLRAFFAIIAVAGVAVATRLLMAPTNFASVITSSVIIGLVGGVAAYLVGMSRLATLTGAVGGIMLGDVIVNLVQHYSFGRDYFAFGASGVFDSIVLASVVGILVLSAISALRHAQARRNVKRHSLSFEASEDQNLNEYEHYHKVEGKKDKNAVTKEEEEKFREYFD
ncbi:MAG: hypothetical protein FWC11_06400 [Firmicutes bacterium]|nr:hypothetical protein [Bacillota bacterium]MCL2256461.1 hypothetical protein [Bacillota bacterium]